MKNTLCLLVSIKHIDSLIPDLWFYGFKQSLSVFTQRLRRLKIWMCCMCVLVDFFKIYQAELPFHKREVSQVT